MPATAPPVFASLQTVIKNLDEVPYCSGTVPLEETTSTLFYQSIDQSRTERLDFTKVTDQQLNSLAKECDPVIGQKDVVAGEMDANRFATHFSPAESGILEIISDILLRGRVPEKSIRLELDKLNVHGPGSFIKAHANTPRSDTVFGFLVVVLPTVHEGGSFVIRQNGQEWRFGSSKTTESSTPQAAFVAFLSGVEHEVMPVSSGYRVTLTYNIRLKKKNNANAAAVAEFGQTETQIKNALEGLLKDTAFFPDGGLLGFGFAHRYPFSQATTNLSDLGGRLKGADAAIKRACDLLSLTSEVRAVYRGDEGAVLLDHFAELGDEEIESDMVEYLSENENGVVIYDSPDYNRRANDSGLEGTPIAWVKPLSKTNSFSTSYIAYGNEASLSCVYGELCLVAAVLPKGERGL